MFLLLGYVIIIIIVIAGQGHTTKQNRNKQTNTKTKELISSYNWQRGIINNSQAPPFSTTATHT